MKKHPTRKRLYVDEAGNVFQLLTASISHGGYHTVKIGKETVRRHTLVCETYHGPRPPGQETRHLNGDPGDDRPTNLAWGTKTENGADMVDHGRSTRGAKNTHVVLTEEQVQAIRQRRRAGESGRSLAEEFGVHEATICDIHKGRHWKWLPRS